MSPALPFAVAALAVIQGSSDGGEPGPTYVLRSIEVTPSPIFGERSARGNQLRRLADATHWTTRESVILREVWKRLGDEVDGSFAAELERNLRSTGLFAEVVVTLRPIEGPNEGTPACVLDVRTRDRLSISGGASGSFVGNVASGGVSLSESNLFGTGDRLGFSYTENDLGETRGALGYRDRYVAGTWTSGAVDIGRTDEGDFYGLRLDRPFRYLEDDFSWSVAVRDAFLDREYFATDEIVAEVPFQQQSLDAQATWRAGERFDFWTKGVNLAYRDLRFDAARGPAAADIRVPGDTSLVYLGGTLGRAHIRRFDKVTGLDTLRFVQDLELATRAGIGLGATLRDEDGRGSASLQPTADANFADRREVAPSRYLSSTLNGTLRIDGGETVGWSLAARASYFDLRLDGHTFAASVLYAHAEEDQGLPAQLTLGEGGGLRGYPRRQFAGTRIAALNLEDRIDPGLSLGSIDFGAAVFFDVGWVGDPGEGFGRPFTSAGAGLRLGSNRLLGSGVVRIDVSFPLDDVEGSSLETLVTATLGQSFEF